MTNVHHLFNTTPEQRATDHLKAILMSGAAIAEDWLGYGAALNEIKARHGDNRKAFGKAVADAGLDKWPEGYSTNMVEKNIQSNTRNAAMWAAAITSEELAGYMDAHPNVEVSVKGGFRGLHAAVIRETKQSKASSEDVEPKMKKSRTPKLDKARAAVADLVREGKPVNSHKLWKQIGISHVTIEAAVACEKAFIEGYEKRKSEEASFEPVIDTGTLSMTAQQKLEAAKRRMEKQVTDELTKEFDRIVAAEVQRTVDKLLPTYRSDMERANQITKAYHGVMTKGEYNTILFCLHPDQRKSVSDEKLDEAFRIMREREIAFLPGVTTSTKVSAFKNMKDTVMKSDI